VANLLRRRKMEAMTVAVEASARYMDEEGAGKEDISKGRQKMMI
jgi:hypothetical protein